MSYPSETFEQDLILALAQDFNNPATKEMLNLCLQEQERSSDSEEDTREDRVKLELKRALLYMLAGFQEEAEIARQDAFELASNFGLI